MNILFSKKYRKPSLLSSWRQRINSTAKCGGQSLTTQHTRESEDETDQTDQVLIDEFLLRKNGVIVCRFCLCCRPARGKVNERAGWIIYLLWICCFEAEGNNLLERKKTGSLGKSSLRGSMSQSTSYSRSLNLYTVRCVCVRGTIQGQPCAT